MGFFSKIGKGIKSAFKKIGRGVKSAFQSFGKFMNKFGVLGQVAMFFIAPHIAGALMKGFGAVWGGIAGQTGAQVVASTAAANATAVAAGQAAGATAAQIAAGKVAETAIANAATASAAAVSAGTTLGAQTAATGLMSGGAVSQAVGSLMQSAGNFVTQGVNVFRNVTEGVTNFIGEFSKTAANKLSGALGFKKVPFADASANFFGAGDSAWKASTDKLGTRMSNLTADKKTIQAFDEIARGNRLSVSTSAVTGEPVTLEKLESTSTTAVDVLDSNPVTVEELGVDVLEVNPADALEVNPADALEANPVKVEELGVEPSPTTTSDSVSLSNTEPKSLLERGQEYIGESWDRAKDQLQDEVTNFGPNIVKRAATTITDIPSLAINTKVNEFLAPDPLTPFVSRGPAQLQIADITGTPDMTGGLPQANYGVQMGTMPYGNAAVIAHYNRYMQTSLTG